MENVYCYEVKATEWFHDIQFALKRGSDAELLINAELIAATSTLTDINIKDCWVIKRPVQGPKVSGNAYWLFTLASNLI